MIQRHKYLVCPAGPWDVSHEWLHSGSSLCQSVASLSLQTRGSEATYITSLPWIPYHVNSCHHSVSLFLFPLSFSSLSCAPMVFFLIL